MNPGIIDPQAAEKREMQRRAANVNFASGLLSAMAQGRPDIAKELPSELFTFAIGCAEQIQMYLERPFDEPSRLVQ